jgi:hypothetical protein
MIRKATKAGARGRHECANAIQSQRLVRTTNACNRLFVTIATWAWPIGISTCAH